MVVTAAAFMLLGYEVSRRLWPDGLGPFERICYALLIGTAAWLGTLWITAILHVMTPPVLLGRTAAAALVAIALLAERRRKASPREDAPAIGAAATSAVLLVAIPLMLWSVFILWRGAVIPPVSHDALAHHLPKAVLFARAGGYEHLGFLDARIRNIPANYELLLAEAILLDQRDDRTEWISYLFYLMLIAGSAALVERWWKLQPAAAAVAAMFVAGVPVALLHSGAHKNDLMVAAFLVAGLVATGRWLALREPRILLLVVVAFAAAVGTKPQAAAVALCIAPLIIWRAGFVVIARAAAAGVIAFLLLGGFVYVSNFVNERALIGVSAAHSRETVVAYGDWANLWQAPYVLLAAPFTGSTYELPVPWSDRPWFWRKYELFFSHLGIPFALCALATPFAMLLFRGQSERYAITFAALASFVLILPVDFRPHGMFAISLPRYALFIVPIAFGWTVGPLLRGRALVAIAAAGAIAFSWYAIDNAEHDTFAPMEYVNWARQNRGTRVVAFDANRAASLVDRRAGATEPVAIAAGYGTWIHPMFGAGLERPVHFIPSGEIPVRIPDNVRWVAVDRSFSSIWEHPDFKDLSQVRQFLVRGQAGPEEMKVFNALRDDRRFQLVVYNRTTNQAVFRRIQ